MILLGLRPYKNADHALSAKVKTLQKAIAKKAKWQRYIDQVRADIRFIKSKKKNEGVE